MVFNLNRLGWIIAVILAIVLIFKTCGKNKKTITVTTPEVVGGFDEQRPVYITEKDTVYITKWKTKTEVVEIKTQNPVNDSLAKAYAELQDQYDTDLERYKMYLDAIQIRSFSNYFEDDNIKLNLSGKVQGDLLSVTPEYTIKSRKIETEIEDSGLRLLIGPGIGNNLNFNDFTYRINIGVQNAKGNIIRGGWSKMRGDNYIFLEFDYALLKLN